jgi:hypothetical protein
MSETRVLFLVAQYSHPVALARHARDSSVFGALRHLEAGGFLWREHGQYRLTRRGRGELAIARALIRLAPRFE